MLDYDVLWCDGNGAASRGAESDGYVKTHIKVENEQEMWKLAYLLRLLKIIKSASMKNIPSIKKELEDYGYEDYEVEELLNRNNYDEKALDSINTDMIDGGEPWIISIHLNGNQIYTDGFSEVSENNDDDW